MSYFNIFNQNRRDTLRSKLNVVTSLNMLNTYIVFLHKVFLSKNELWRVPSFSVLAQNWLLVDFPTKDGAQADKSFAKNKYFYINLF